MSGDKIAVNSIVYFVHKLAIELDRHGALRREGFAFILASCLEERDIHDHAPTRLALEQIVHLLTAPDKGAGGGAGWKPSIIKGGKV